MLDIERELQNDPTGEYKTTMLMKLTITMTDVRHELLQDLVADEIEKLTKLLQALKLSIKIIERY